MQVVIALPARAPSSTTESWERRVFRPVAGVPLLQRVIAASSRAGVGSVLVLVPDADAADMVRRGLEAAFLAGTAIDVTTVGEAFDPRRAEHWQRIAHRLEPSFLWLPWSAVTVKATLATLLAEAEAASRAVRLVPRDAATAVADPSETVAVVRTEELARCGNDLGRYLTSPDVEGVPESPVPVVHVRSRSDLPRAETVLVRGSGKPSDGFYSRFNRRLCHGAVRWLLRTPVTANMVTWAGLPVVVVSGLLYAEGRWSGYALGGLLYFVSVLLDEIDGMVARTKFQESPFGCWLETFVDYASYLILWTGLSVGLYRQYGSVVWPALGGAVMLANVLTFLVLLRQRRAVTPADHPEQYQRRFYGRLEADSTSIVSRGIRKVVFLAKRGVMSHFVLLFSVLNLVPVLFGFVVTGSLLTLVISLYMNRLFRLPGGEPSSDWAGAVRP